MRGKSFTSNENVGSFLSLRGGLVPETVTKTFDLLYLYKILLYPPLFIGGDVKK